MKVLAIIITYNRSNLLKECIESIKSGSIIPDILVVDNASTDETESVVKSYKDVFYLKLDKNFGPAGGAEAGQKFALQHDYDAVWMLDDDVWVSKDALKEIIDAYEKLKKEFSKLLLSSVTFGDRDFTKPFYNFLKYDFNSGLTKKIPDKEFLKEYFEYDIAPMNGLFIPIAALKEVGTFNGKLWGWYDDTEFVLRCKKVGYRGFAVTKSKIFHPLEARKQVKIFNKTFTLLSGRPFRMYLGTRNNIYVQKNMLKKTNFYFRFLPVFITKRFISIVFFYDNKGIFLKNFFFGIIDGLRGNLEVKNV